MIENIVKETRFFMLQTNQYYLCCAVVQLVLCHVAAVKRIPVHNQSADYILIFLSQ